MWLRHGKPKECSHFLRLANKKEKNVNEGTKISEVSFFFTAAALKWSASIPFSSNQNTASLATANTQKRKHRRQKKNFFFFLGCLKYYRNVTLGRFLPFSFQSRGSSPTAPIKPLPTAACLVSTVQRLRRKASSHIAVRRDSACKSSQAQLSLHFFFFNSTVQAGINSIQFLWRPGSNGWSEPLGTFRSWSHVVPTNVR